MNKCLNKPTKLLPMTAQITCYCHDHFKAYDIEEGTEVITHATKMSSISNSAA